MPIYKWTGVDCVGQTVHGKAAADSPAELDGLLFARQIALIRAQQMTTIFLKPPSLRTRIRFFQQCSVMLTAGITLAQILRTLAQAHEQELGMQLLIRALLKEVQSGVPLHVACSAYPIYFDTVTLAMIRSGEQSGALAGAMAAIAHRLEMKAEFVSRFRSALMVPALTLCFFVAACFIIFGWILPSFATLFAASFDRLPTTTRLLLHLSSYFQLYTLLCGFVGVMGVYVCIRTTIKQQSRSVITYVHATLLNLPWLGYTLRIRYWLHFFEAVGILLEQSVLIVPALQVATQAVHNEGIRRELQAVQNEVSQGLSLHAALAQHLSGCDSLILTMIATGEHIAQVPHMITFVCRDLRAVLFARLTRMSMIVQPLLLLLLGVLVAFLIFSVYVPLISICGTF